MIVNLSKLWLAPVNNLSQGLGVWPISIEHDPTVNVTVNGYANGVNRMISQPGRQRFAQVGLDLVTARQVTVLKAWQGTLLLYRDLTGETFTGVYGASTSGSSSSSNTVSFTPHPTAPTLWQAALTVAEVTYPLTA